MNVTRSEGEIVIRLTADEARALRSDLDAEAYTSGVWQKQREASGLTIDPEERAEMALFEALSREIGAALETVIAPGA